MCQLVEEPSALSMSERAWASSLNVCAMLLVWEVGSDLDDGAELCWGGRAGVGIGSAPDRNGGCIRGLPPVIPLE